jgi:L-iditol 2-dehydrogenase
VVGANSAPCGRCEYCNAGREALCDDLLFVNGAFAECLLVPAPVVDRNLYHRPAALPPREAAGVDPVACVLKGVEVAAPRPGSTAVLLGAGPVAILFAQALASRDVRSFIFARSEQTAAVARTANAAEVVVRPSLTENVEELRSFSRDGRGFDLVVEAAGAAETSEAAPGLARKGGRVLLFGGCASETRITISPSRLHYYEIDLLSSFHHTPRHVAAALDALAGGGISLAPLLADPVSLEGVASALERMTARTVRRKVPVLPHG